MNIRDVALLIKNELAEDLKFFEYDNIITCVGDECTFMLVPNEVVSTEDITDLVMRSVNKHRIKSKVDMRDDNIIISIAMDNKALDDAIKTQKAVLGKLSKMMGDLVRGWENIEMEAEAEFIVDLSDESPFKKLSKSQLRNINTVEKTYRMIPRFMYFEDELKVYDGEYKDIIAKIHETNRKRELRILTKAMEQLENGEMENEEVEVPELAKMIVEMFKKYKAEYDTKLENVTTKGDLINVIKGMISKRN